MERPENELPTEQTDKSKVTWGPAAGIFGSLAALLIATILIAIAFPSIAESDVSLAYRFVVEVIYAALIVAIIVMLVRSSGGHFSALGIKSLKAPKKDLAQIVKVFLIYLGVSLVLFQLLSFFVPENVLDADQDLGYGEGLTSLQLVLVAVSLIVVVPIAEEVMFRGFLFKGLRTKLDFWPAAILASALFGLAHGQLNVGVDVAILALGACWLLEKTGSLYASILLHALKNSIAFLLVFVVEL